LFKKKNRFLLLLFKKKKKKKLFEKEIEIAFGMSIALARLAVSEFEMFLRC